MVVTKLLNSLRPRQNERHFADDIFKGIFLNENVWIPIKFSLKFVPKGLINNIPALVQIMAWRRPGDKPLSGPMIVSLLTNICVTRPQWVKEHKSYGEFITNYLNLPTYAACGGSIVWMLRKLTVFWWRCAVLHVSQALQRLLHHKVWMHQCGEFEMGAPTVLISFPLNWVWWHTSILLDRLWFTLCILYDSKLDSNC